MPEIKKEALKDAIVVSNLFDYNNPGYRYAEECAQKINLLPLIYDKILIEISKPIAGFPETRFRELVENGVFVGIIYGLTSNKFEDSQILRKYEKVDYFGINLDDELGMKLGKEFDIDESDEEFLQMIVLQVLHDSERHLTSGEIGKAAHSVIIGISCDIIASKYLDLPLFAKSDQSSLWRYRIKRINNEIDVFNNEFQHRILHQNNTVEALNYFLRDLNIFYPSNLNIDQIIEFRKDKARNNFKNWINSYTNKISREAELDDCRIVAGEMAGDFNELSRSICDEMKDRSCLLNASLTGMATALTGIINPILAIPTSMLAPFMLNKPTLFLFSELMKKYSDRNWVVYFTEFKEKANM